MKKKILIFCDYYLPGYKAGGPIKSISNLVDLLADDFDFFVVTRNKDYQDINVYSTVASNQWNKIGNSQVYYLPSKNIISHIFSLKKILKEQSFDYIYLNSFFSFNYSIIPRLLALISPKSRVVIAPRGEFFEPALKSKNSKKIFFINIAKMFNLYKNISFHASTDLEKITIMNNFNYPKLTIIVAPDITFSFYHQDQESAKEKKKNTLKIVYISRILKHKNLLLALHCLKSVDNIAKNIVFDIFGPIDDTEYWKECETVIQTIQNIKIDFKGALEQKKVDRTLKNYDIMILPTFSENYGHSIIEALSQGLPVIISDNTPWRNLEENKAGFDLPLTEKEKFTDKILYFYNMSNNDFLEWNQGAKNYIRKNIDIQEVKDANRNLFNG